MPTTQCRLHLVETQYKTSSICMYNNNNNKRKKTTDLTMPDRERKRVPDHRSDVLKVSHPYFTFDETGEAE